MAGDDVLLQGTGSWREVRVQGPKRCSVATGARVMMRWLCSTAKYILPMAPHHCGVSRTPQAGSVYGPNVLVPQNSHVEALPPDMIVTEVGLWEVVRIR